MECATLTTLANEEWRPVKGYDGIYEVSNFGRVRSLDRCVVCSNGVRNISGQIIKPYTDTYGYKVVKLRNGKTRKMFFVHRLVATSFICNPNNLPVVNHKDENKENNHSDNLEWCTEKYNTNYGSGKFRKANTWKKRIEQLTLDGKHVAFYDSAADLERLTGGKYNRKNISMAARGANKTAYGYKWIYK